MQLKSFFSFDVKQIFKGMRSEQFGWNMFQHDNLDPQHEFAGKKERQEGITVKGSQGFFDSRNLLVRIKSNDM